MDVILIGNRYFNLHLDYRAFFAEELMIPTDVSDIFLDVIIVPIPQHRKAEYLNQINYGHVDENKIIGNKILGNEIINVASLTITTWYDNGAETKEAIIVFLPIKIEFGLNDLKDIHFYIDKCGYYSPLTHLLS